ncbi:hypothetical protein HYV50_02915 [Candidatus Pacearchaeota archaeon]|nr:hypothetical protein [Candidatus Pacearchaeota archaeon]
MKAEINLQKLLKKIIIELSGQVSEKLVDLLYKKNNVNEFLIAKKLGLTINQTRNILYKLGEEGVVGFVRKKDKKKGGWYTYFWTLNIKKSLQKYEGKIKKEIEKHQNQINDWQRTRFYYCKNCDSEFNEEDALLHNYTCPECGETLEIKDNTETIEKIKSEISKLENILSLIGAEIKMIESKELKAKEKRIKEEQRQKELERKKRKRQRKREKVKLNKKIKNKPKHSKKITKARKKIKVKKRFSKFAKKFFRKRKKRRKKK